MSRVQKSPTLYAHPFSKAYWRDAVAELKDIRMLVITALMIALRVALKPLAIPLGPQLSIQTAMLATALGAMIFGPVMAIPAAIISDTIGFMIWPNGDYFLPFVLTEIASTMAYALCLYRAKPSTIRVMLARFLICFVVNIIDLVFNTVIARNVRLSEAPSHGMSVLEYDRYSKGAKNYTNLAKELIRKHQS